MASSTGHLIVVSIALVLLHELLPVMTADVPAANLESHGKTAPSEGRPVNRRQSLLELDRLLYAYPNDSLDIDGRFSADAHYKKYYECYCNDTMDLFQVTLPCDELMNNTIQGKEEANRVVLAKAGIEDSISNRYSLYDVSIRCTLRVYYDDVYDCYCASVQEYYNTTKLPCDKMKENSKIDREDLNDWILQDSGVVFHWYTRITLNRKWAGCVFSSLRKKEEMLNTAHTNGTTTTSIE